jgi:predicted outer membrane protein
MMLRHLQAVALIVLVWTSHVRSTEHPDIASDASPVLWHESKLMVLLDQKSAVHDVIIKDSCTSDLQRTIPWAVKVLTSEELAKVIGFCKWMTRDSFILPILESGSCTVMHEEFGETHISSIGPPEGNTTTTTEAPGGRQKRVVFALLFVVSVVALAFVSAESYLSESDKERLQQGLQENVQDAINAKDLATSVVELEKEVLEIAKNMTADRVRDYTALATIMDYKTVTSNLSVMKRQDVKTAMDEWASGRLGHVFNRTFPVQRKENIIPYSSTPEACAISVTHGLIRFRYRVMIEDTRKKVYEATAFKLYLDKSTNHTNITCISEYQGPDFAIQDETQDCLAPVHHVNKIIDSRAMYPEPDLRCGKDLSETEKDVWKVTHCLNGTFGKEQVSNFTRSN